MGEEEDGETGMTKRRGSRTKRGRRRTEVRWGEKEKDEDDNQEEREEEGREEHRRDDCLSRYRC